MTSQASCCNMESARVTMLSKMSNDQAKVNGRKSHRLYVLGLVELQLQEQSQARQGFEQNKGSPASFRRLWGTEIAFFKRRFSRAPSVDSFITDVSNLPWHSYHRGLKPSFDTFITLASDLPWHSYHKGLKPSFDNFITEVWSFPLAP